MNNNNAVLGILAGAAIGAIAGILFAPEKGSTTRRQIADSSDDYMDELKSQFNKFTDSLEQKLDSTKKDADYLADKGKSKYNDLKKESKNAASDVQNSI